MSPQEILQKYLEPAGGKPQKGQKGISRYITIRAFLNRCIAKGYKELTFDAISENCKAREGEMLKTQNTRITTMRHLVRFCNSECGMQLPMPQRVKEPHARRLLKSECPLQKSVISDHMEEYVQYVRNSIKSESAIRLYVDCLRRFNDYICKTYPDAQTLTNDMVAIWCQKRDTECPASRNCRVRPVRNFFKFAYRKNWWPGVEIPENLPHIRENPRIPHAFTDEEISEFFNLVDNIPDAEKKNERHNALRRMVPPVYFRLLYSTGMRTCEARWLLRENVHLDTGVIDILSSKGPGQHRVALHPSMLEILKTYDAAVDRLMPNRKVFFPDGEDQIHCKTWQSDVFRPLWKERYGTDAVPYDFRSHYAVANINKWTYDGGDWFDKLLVLSRTMGHSKIESTCYYYQLAPIFPDMLQELSGADLNTILANSNFIFDDEETR